MKLEEIPSIVFLNNSEITIIKKDDCYFAEIPIQDGFIHFEFSEFDFAARTKECVIKCWIEIAGGKQDAFEQRINILSASAKNDFVRQLTISFGKQINWSLVFSNVCVQVSKALEESKVARSYSDFQDKLEADLLSPFLRDEAVNVFFGMGGSGKTFLSLEMGLSVAFNLPFLGYMPSRTGNVLFIDYESNHRDFFDRLSLLAANKNLLPADLDKRMFRFDPEGLPFHDIKNILRREIQSRHIVMIIIDSAALAAGGEPESAAIATRLFNSINSLKVCTLLIAHRTKSEDSEKYPFGSVFFYNSARIVWYVKSDQEQGEDELHIGLIHRKSNNAKASPPHAVEIRFEPGLVSIQEESNARWSSELSIKSRILNSLDEGAKTVKELSQDLDVPIERIGPRLTELKSRGKVDNLDGQRWQSLRPKEIAL